MVRLALLGCCAGLMVMAGGAIVQPSIAQVRSDATAPTNAQKSQSMKAEADRLFDEGIQQYQVSQFESAFQSWQKALKIYREIKDRFGEGNALGHLGLVYKSLGNYPKAIKYQEQSLAIFREIKGRKGERSSLGNLGVIYVSLGNYPKAIEYQEQSLAISREIKDQNSEGRSLVMLGISYNFLGNYPKAIKYQEQGLAIFRAIKDRKGESMALGSLGSSYTDLGNYGEAIKYQEQSLAIKREIQDRHGEGVTLGNLGIIYDTLGNYKKAIEYQEQSLAIKREIQDRHGEGNALGNLGLAYDAIGNYTRAIDYHEQSLVIFRSIKARQNEGAALAGLGNSYHSLRRYHQAIEYHKQHLTIARDIRDRQAEGNALGNLGLAYNALGNYATAIKYHEQRLSIAHEIKDRQGERKGFRNIGYILQKQNKFNSAIAFYKKSVNITESIRNDIKSLSRQEQSSYTQTIASTYRRLASLLIQQNRLAEAQQVLELLKIRELKEIEPNQLQNQTPIRQLPISDIEKQEIAKINPEIAKEIKIEPLPKNDHLSPTNPLNQSAQTLLNAKPNSVLIYHLITQDNLWIILATPDGKLQKLSSNANQAEVESLTTTVRDQIEKCEKQYAVCDKNDTQTLNQTTQKLYQRLFPPDLQAALTQAKTQHLTLALDGSLRNIPIAALHTGSQYLIEQYTLSTIIAAQLTDPTDKIPSIASQTPILAVGTSKSSIVPVPDFVDRDGQDNFPSLANTPVEVNTIVNPSTFPGNIFLDKDFTLTNLQQHLPKAGLFHIASHGIFRPNFLDYSYILMGNNQRWSIAQMDSDPNAKLFQNIHMVTLSACQTGLSGRDKTGMEIAGMSHAFMSKGAKAVTASLWQVEDESTAMFMQHYYRNLTTQSKAEALRTAQLKLLRTPRNMLVSQLSRSLSKDEATRFEGLKKQSKTQPSDTSKIPKTRDYTHPYYWAPFILIGNSL